MNKESDSEEPQTRTPHSASALCLTQTHTNMSTTNFKRPRTDLPHDPCFISLDSPTLEQEAVQLVCRVKKGE